MIILMILPLLIMTITFGLFIWQAVWVAIDSRKKGEEYWWIWTIAAIIAFPIGLIVYVLVVKTDRNRCNNCGKDVPKDIKSCPYCGVKCGLFCPSCGQKVESNWRYCPNCTIELPEEITNSKSPKKVDKKIIIIIVAIGILLLSIISLMIISFTSYTTIGGKSVIEEVVEINNENAAVMGYLGNEYDTPYTAKRSYTTVTGVNSVTYLAERKSGEIIIRIYDSEGNILGESDVIKDKKIDDVFKINNGYGTKIEIEYIDFEGSFFFDF